MSYEWDHNCAVVDRCFYYLYIIRGTSIIFGGLALRDLWLIKQNWFPERLRGRIPMVFNYVYLVPWSLGCYKCSFSLVLALAFNS